MIRYAYINNTILQLYRKMDAITFPLDPKNLLIGSNFHVKFSSYDHYAKVTNSTYEEIIDVCGSPYGCTQADLSTNRYLILYNESPEYTVPGRTRWTIAHEIGHIALKHHSYMKFSCLKSGDIITKRDFELEADYFAASALAPMPLFPYLKISSAQDVCKNFGLSKEASNNRWNDYLRWRTNHKKTSFENDLVKIYCQKAVLPSVTHKMG